MIKRKFQVPSLPRTTIRGSKFQVFRGKEKREARSERDCRFLTANFQFKKLKIFLLFLLLQPSAFSLQPLFAYDYDFGYEYWNLSFFSPARSYRLTLWEKSPDGSSSLGYQRTNRFGNEDNTFAITWAESQKSWGWEWMGAFTPRAGSQPRHVESLTIYLPSMLVAGSEPFAGVGYKRFNEARVSHGMVGLTYRFAQGWDFLLRASRVRTDFVNSNSKPLWSNGQSFGLSADVQEGVRLNTWISRWKEFFDSGNPFAPSAFSVQEKGGALIWQMGQGVYLNTSYALETRSNETTLKKYALTVGQRY